MILSLNDDNIFHIPFFPHSLICWKRCLPKTFFSFNKNISVFWENHILHTSNVYTVYNHFVGPKRFPQWFLSSIFSYTFVNILYKLKIE